MLSLVLFAHEWVNIVPETRIGGRMASNGYMRGKVVLLDCRDYSSKKIADDVEVLKGIWQAYKTKPFVLLGMHNSPERAERAKRIANALKVTYPLYSGVGLKDSSGNDVPLEEGIYVFDMTGRKLYSGGSPRQAMGIAGNAIFAVRIPASPAQWKETLDYEIANLPGSAYLRIKSLRSRKDDFKAFSRDYPEALKSYAEVWKGYLADKDVPKLAKLVEIARLVKDRDSASSASKRMSPARLTELQRRYESLKTSANPLVAQEAKNSLADIEFVKAELGK